MVPADEMADTVDISEIPRKFDEEPDMNASTMMWYNEQVAKRRRLQQALENQIAEEISSAWSWPDSPSRALEILQQNVNLRQAVNGTALACTAATVTMTSLPNLTVLLS